MSITLMASTISTSINLCSSPPFPNTKSTTCYLSTSSVSCSRTSTFALSTVVPPLSLCPFSSWNGLRRLGLPISQKSVKIERRGRCKGKVIYASLFGVGAPEALVIGVVALLVFGPKGLAEVARNLGKTLRAFQPTIRELQDVSREFKNTLEREIGLDDISISPQNTYSPNTTNSTSTPSSTAKTEDSGAVEIGIDDISIPPQNTYSPETSNSTSIPSSSAKTEDSGAVVDFNVSPSNRAYSSEEYLKITEEQLKASASQQQEQTPPLGENQLEAQTQPQPQGSVQEVAAAIPPSHKSESEA